MENIMKKIFFSFIALLLITGFSSCKKGIDATKLENEALKSAELWLQLSDNNDFEQCWEKASSYYKNAVKKGELVKSLTAVRKPLGKMISRIVDSKKYQESLPGAPDGKYVIVQFKTSFHNKKDAIETITPMKEKDGKWRVSGYYIK